MKGVYQYKLTWLCASSHEAEKMLFAIGAKSLSVVYACVNDSSETGIKRVEAYMDMAFCGNNEEANHKVKIWMYQMESSYQNCYFELIRK